MHCVGLHDSVACNCNAEATADDGSCDFARANEPLHTLVVEGQPAVVAGMTVRFYVTLQTQDRISAIYGNNEAELSERPRWRIQQHIQCKLECVGRQPGLLDRLPELASDTTPPSARGPGLGLGHLRRSGSLRCGDATQPITPFFLNDGATSLLSNTLTGASWYVLNTAANESRRQ